MQANGRADTYFEHIFPTYTEIAETARVFLEEQGKTEPRVMALLADIPLRTTTKLPDFNRGYVDSYVHYEPAANVDKRVPTEALLSRRTQAEDGRELVAITRGDLDDTARQKRAECKTCKHESACEGVWGNYVKRYGWDEFVPVKQSE